MMKPFVYVLLVSITLISCQCGNQQKRGNYPDPETIENNRIEARKEFLKKERESIEAYQKDNNLELNRTGTGLYYSITNDAPGGDSIESGDVVEYEYKIYSLNGNLLYSSGENNTAVLKVDRQDAEIGLHEALKLLGVGDEGLFILPSHLAFGVGGDMNKVPPMTSLRYELKIINVQKSKS